MAAAESAPVVFSELACQTQAEAAPPCYVGLAVLNLPQALNALNVTMVRLLLQQLRAWQQRPDIVAVILRGTGDRAFCAGGDVVALYRAMQQSPRQTPSLAKEFFTEEYQLDHLIHSYAKPVAVWGSGIVMGGGMGLLMGASHRIVTASSRLAMPEVSIGLYPDVGGSYFLNAMPRGCGLFAGLTAASINAADALGLNLGDYFLSEQQFDEFVAGIRSLPWQPHSGKKRHQERDQQLLSQWCEQLQSQHRDPLPTAQFERQQPLMTALAEATSLPAAVTAIAETPANDDPWLHKAQVNLRSGSPITMHLVFQQLRRGRGMSLADCLRMELAMSFRCAAVGEFQEGVRALLIDKDRQPQWRYAAVEQVPADLIESFFKPQWPGEHPLSTLAAAAESN